MLRSYYHSHPETIEFSELVSDGQAIGSRGLQIADNRCPYEDSRRLTAGLDRLVANVPDERTRLPFAIG